MDAAEAAWKWGLQNAINHHGKADVTAVLRRVMADPKYRKKSTPALVAKIVAQINLLSGAEQRDRLKAIAPQLLEPSHKAKKGLPPLPGAVRGNVVTRFPPEPNGYLHIGHAKAAWVDYEYARMYRGKFILRFDDTNPTTERLEYYGLQKEDLQWLGIQWDKELCTSNAMPALYSHATKLIELGGAYVCTCDSSAIRERRSKGAGCACRSIAVEEQKRRWERMRSDVKEKGILRLKGDMNSANTAMRDPTLFRIVTQEHPLQGNRYRVWPTYDFAGPVMDSITGVTHAFRTKEYELRDEVYFYLLKMLGLRAPTLLEFSRLQIEGMPCSKRALKPLVTKGIGWDDPRLPTLRGLRRRGIQPEAIREFVLAQGIGKGEAVLTFDRVEAINRKVLDPITPRYFFVPGPVPLTVEDAPIQTATLKMHPHRDLGKRSIKTEGKFFIPRGDVTALKVGGTFRLKDLYNVRVTDLSPQAIQGAFAGTHLTPGIKKVQWVTPDNASVEVLMPGPLFVGGIYNPDSLRRVKGTAEKATAKVKVGSIVQFERFGFCRKDDDAIFVFAHQ